MASGVPTVVYGPREVYSVDYVARRRCCTVVTKRDPGILLRALREVMTGSREVAVAADRARQIAFQDHNVRDIRRRFERIMWNAANDAHGTESAVGSRQSSSSPGGWRLGEIRVGRGVGDLPKPLIVLGNGPSLREFEFDKLKKFDVIGMNAAYRYWDKISWYPRYYACLDTVVGLSHQGEIERLVRESSKNGIELFLLRANLIGRSETLRCPFLQ